MKNSQDKVEFPDSNHIGQIEMAHACLREALGLTEDAPRRFDYYAQCINKQRDEIMRLNGVSLVAENKLNKLSRLYAESQIISFVPSSHARAI